LDLRYGSNPDQMARASLGDEGSPVRVLSGQPSYINVLDALGAWELVREAATVLSVPVATTFKHVSPAGVAIAGELDDVMRRTWAPDGGELSDIAKAYIRARDCDPKSSFGDFVAVSQPVDDSLARVLRGVVSDGIIAPGYEPGTVETLAAKKNGQYPRTRGDTTFTPPQWESRELGGVRLEQQRPTAEITAAIVRSGTKTSLPDSAVTDLVLAMVAARHTQSNTVTYARAGMVVGIGAGQQSRVDCTKLAGAKVDTWWLRRNPTVLALPFLDDVRRQDRINWEIRYIEGDMDQPERERFRAALNDDAPRARPGRTARLARPTGRRGARIRRLHPVPRQHRPGRTPRSPLHRRPGRLEPQRRSRSGLRRARHRHHNDRDPAVPALSARAYRARDRGSG